MQFSLRTLLLLTTLAAVLAGVSYHLGRSGILLLALLLMNIGAAGLFVAMMRHSPHGRGR